MSYLKRLLLIALVCTISFYSGDSLANGNFKPLYKLDFDQSPNPGDNVTFTLDTNVFNTRAAEGSRVGILIGMKPNKFGIMRTPKYFIKNGQIDSQGKFITNIAVPSNMAWGEERYFRAFVLDQGKIRRSELKGALITPKPEDADYIVTTNSYHNVQTGQTVQDQSAMRNLYPQLVNSGGGQVIILEDGHYGNYGELSLNSQLSTCQNNEKIWIMARNNQGVHVYHHPQTAQIWYDGVCNTVVMGLHIRTGHWGISWGDDHGQGTQGLWLLETVMDGYYNHETLTGDNSKWCINGHNSGDLLMRNVTCKNVKKEHFFYHHQQKGEIRIEDSTIINVGRTAIQFVARPEEGPLGYGDITFRNNYIEDIGLEGYSYLNDFNSGHAVGTPLTTAGGNPNGTMLVDNNAIVSGYNQAINNNMHSRFHGSTWGSGGLVAWCERGTPIGRVIMKNNVFNQANDGGDRPQVQVQNCSANSFRFNNNYLKAGLRESITIDTERVNTANFDESLTNNDINGSVVVGFMPNGNGVQNPQFHTYESFINTFFNN